MTVNELRSKDYQRRQERKDICHFWHPSMHP